MCVEMKYSQTPKVIFLDAVGTIFGVKNNVGHIYTQLASKYGVVRDAQIINQYFYQAFKKSPPLAFGEIEYEQVRKLEYIWWEKIAYQTFAQANALKEFTDFYAFFQELYEYFKTHQPWYIYEEVIPCLNQWQQEGIELAIISNFDTRIYAVLESLKLRSYFKTITISSLTGVAKPDRQIFLTALDKHQCSPEEAWYIGDSLREDYWGARNLGIKSFWLQRRN
jgi:putative hydrolase of the HAD superfamily